MHNSYPIGIFDSGVGGLTVASAIKQILPDEELIYFGDTAHLPYGDKSIESIQSYSVKITDFLLENNCKVILIACNSASSTAFERVKDHVGNRALVINVIDPVIEYIKEREFKRVGVIGTKATVNSFAYQRKIDALPNRIMLKSLATPLFVPMIEEGFIFDDISNAIIRTYLSHEKLTDIEALILGCTHYPIIKNQISKFYNFNTEIIDSAKIVAMYVRSELTKKDLLKTKRDAPDRFIVSDYTDYFKSIAKMFFEEEIELERLNFWN